MTDYDSALDPKRILALQSLRPILQAFGIPEPDMRKLTITANSIVEHGAYDAVSRAILDYDMPEIAGPVLLDHYTKGSGFWGILTAQALHLAPVTLRLSEGELLAFAVEHGLKGYIDATGAATTLLKEAAKDLFYASFSEPPASARLWDAFGDNGNGYRLRFEVTVGSASNIRAIRYHGPVTLLKQVNDALANASLPRFVLKGVSRVGAFYLSAAWQSEGEVRLLAKRFVGGGAPVIAGSMHEYWKIPIGRPNKTATLKLVQIGVRNLNREIVSNRLPAWCHGIPIVSD